MKKVQFGLKKKTLCRWCFYWIYFHFFVQIITLDLFLLHVFQTFHEANLHCVLL